MGKRRKICGLDGFARAAGVPYDSGCEQIRRACGAKLQQHLLNLTSLGKLAAVDLCIACYWCCGAQVPGADFETYAYPPPTNKVVGIQRIWIPYCLNHGLYIIWNIQPSADWRPTVSQGRHLLV